MKTEDSTISGSPFLLEVQRLGVDQDDMYSAVLAVCKANNIDPPAITDDVFMAMRIINGKLNARESDAD